MPVFPLVNFPCSNHPFISKLSTEVYIPSGCTTAQAALCSPLLLLLFEPLPPHSNVNSSPSSLAAQMVSLCLPSRTSGTRSNAFLPPAGFWDPCGLRYILLSWQHQQHFSDLCTMRERPGVLSPRAPSLCGPLLGFA